MQMIFFSPLLFIHPFNFNGGVEWERWSRRTAPNPRMKNFVRNFPATEPSDNFVESPSPIENPIKKTKSISGKLQHDKYHSS